MTGDYSVYSVLFILTKGRNVSRLANAVLAGYPKFSLPPYHLVPSFGVIPSTLWKSFMVPKTRIFRATDGEDLVILACTVFD